MSVHLTKDQIIKLNGPSWFTWKGGLHPHRIEPGRLTLNTSSLQVIISEVIVDSETTYYCVHWEFARDIDYSKDPPSQRDLQERFEGKVWLSHRDMIRAFLRDNDEVHNQHPDPSVDCTDWGLYFIRYGEFLNIPTGRARSEGAPWHTAVSYHLEPELIAALRQAFPALSTS